MPAAIPTASPRGKHAAYAVHHTSTRHTSVSVLVRGHGNTVARIFGSRQPSEHPCLLSTRRNGTEVAVVGRQCPRWLAAFQNLAAWIWPCFDQSMQTAGAGRLRGSLSQLSRLLLARAVRSFASRRMGAQLGVNECA